MLNPVRPDEYEYYEPLHGNTMFELGGKVNPGLGPPEQHTYKAWFESRGFTHVSVDWDGRFGAINRDLRKPIWDEFGQFDMVCNIGTTEHVSNQPAVWENIHMLTKIGGVLVSVTPYPDGKNWWWHGMHYPTMAFFYSFAQLNGWEIERIGDNLPEPNKNLYVRMRKNEHKPFQMPLPELIHFNQMRPR